MDNRKENYSVIFKTTFLFGFVQVARLLLTVIKNKVVAMLLGPQGVGIISIYNNAIDLIRTGSGLGISQSAVKDISEAKATGDRIEFSTTISVIKKVVYFTSFLGLIVTILLSPLLSKWGFNDYKHILAYIVLSLAVFFNIFLENQLSILKGMRMMRVLAKTSLIGTFIGLIVGVPSIYLWREDGIVVSIICTSVATALYTAIYVAKIDYDRIKLTAREVYKRATPMMKMGVSLMMSNFLAFLSNLLILGFIQKKGGLLDVGFFHAGSVLVISYFSMVTTAMGTDFYPRISECANDNSKLTEEIYKQSQVGLMLLQPLLVGFILYLPWIIKILYTPEFAIVSDYVDIAILGVVISVISNCYGYLIIVKRAAKFYFIVSLIFSLSLIPLYMFFYTYFNILGLGIAYALDVIAQFIVYYLYCNRHYGMSIHKTVITDLSITVALIYITKVLRDTNNPYMIYGIGSLLIAVVLYVAVIKLKKNMGLDIIQIMKSKLNKK